MSVLLLNSTTTTRERKVRWREKRKGWDGRLARLARLAMARLATLRLARLARLL